MSNPVFGGLNRGWLRVGIGGREDGEVWYLPKLRPNVR